MAASFSFESSERNSQVNLQVWCTVTVTVLLDAPVTTPQPHSCLDVEIILAPLRPQRWPSPKRQHMSNCGISSLPPLSSPLLNTVL